MSAITNDMSKLGLSIDPKPAFLKGSNIDFSVINMNFQKFITFLGAKISFKYEEYFDPKNGKCVIKKNRLALKRKGQDSIGAIREAFEALPKEIWRSDKYFKIGNLTIIQVKFTGFYLWQIAKPNMDYLFDPDAFADIGIRFVDETWLTNKIYLKYNCISDSF